MKTTSLYLNKSSCQNKNISLTYHHGGVCLWLYLLCIVKLEDEDENDDIEIVEVEKGWKLDLFLRTQT